MAAELCKCGHDLAAHTGSGVAGVPCKSCGVWKGWLTGKCMGWEPTREEVPDARDQVGVDPTGPAPEDAEPAHPVWGYPFPGAGPPDLDAAVQVGGLALSYAPFNLDLPTALKHARIALTAAWPLIAAEIGQLDLARSDLYDELRTARDGNDRLEQFERAIVDAFGVLRWDLVSAALVALHAPALDGPAAQEEGGDITDHPFRCVTGAGICSICGYGPSAHAAQEEGGGG